MTAPLLTPLEVREFIFDHADENYLLDKEEFSDPIIQMCIQLALDYINLTPPLSSYSLVNFRSKGILLMGTLWYMFLGKSAHLARNHMSYSDGGLQIPIEERMQMYQSLASMYEGTFKTQLQSMKIATNMEGGWGTLSSNYALTGISGMGGIGSLCNTTIVSTDALVSALESQSSRLGTGSCS